MDNSDCYNFLVCSWFIWHVLQHRSQGLAISSCLSGTFNELLRLFSLRIPFVRRQLNLVVRKARKANIRYNRLSNRQINNSQNPPGRFDNRTLKNLKVFLNVKVYTRLHTMIIERISQVTWPQYYKGTDIQK